MDQSKVRRIVEDHIRDLMWALDLNDWMVNVQYRKLDPGVDGNCVVTYKYKHATISLDPNEYNTESEVLEVLLHELLHVVTGPTCMMSAVINRTLTTDEGKAAASACFDNADELLIKQLERMLEVGMGYTPKKLAALGARRKLVKPTKKKRRKKK